MPIAVLLLDGAASDVAVGATSGADLARLGITRAAILRNHETVAVVLEGWAFDPAQASVAAETFGVTGAHARILQPTVEMTVSPMDAGGSDDRPATTGTGRQGG